MAKQYKPGDKVHWGDADTIYTVRSKAPKPGSYWITREGGSGATQALGRNLTPVKDAMVASHTVRDEPFESKADGQEAALASHAAMLWKSDFRAAVEKKQPGDRFTSEDIVAIAGLPSGRVAANANNAVGAMMTALAKAGVIRKTSARVPSRRKSSHGAELVVWQRAS
jgi:hypothetical protein